MFDEKAVKRPEGFNIEDHSKPIFDMYEGDECVVIKLEVRNGLTRYIVARFGINLQTKIISDDCFEVTFKVSLSPTFYVWTFQFDEGIRMLSLANLVVSVTDMATDLINREIL